MSNSSNTVADQKHVDQSLVGDNETNSSSQGITHNSLLAASNTDNATGEEAAEGLAVNTSCQAFIQDCVTQSFINRKVVSHVFGRNKKSTHQIPEELWIVWCRKHYQRSRYRAKSGGFWHTVQLRLVREQLDAFEVCEDIEAWDIKLLKAEQKALDAEDSREAAAGTGATLNDDDDSPRWERFLLPHLGTNKSFNEVRNVLDEIEDEYRGPGFLKRDVKQKVFPGIEFLGVFRTTAAKKVYQKRKLAVKDDSAEKGNESPAEPKRKRRLIRGFDLAREEIA